MLSKKLRITTVCLKEFNSVLSINWWINRVAADFCYQNGQLLSEISQKSEKTKLLKRTQYLAIALVPVISTQVWWTFCIWFGKCIFFHPLSQAKSFDVKNAQNWISWRPVSLWPVQFLAPASHPLHQMQRVQCSIFFDLHSNLTL